MPFGHVIPTATGSLSWWGGNARARALYRITLLQFRPGIKKEDVKGGGGFLSPLWPTGVTSYRPGPLSTHCLGTRTGVAAGARAHAEVAGKPIFRY